MDFNELLVGQPFAVPEFQEVSDKSVGDPGPSGDLRHVEIRGCPLFSDCHFGLSAVSFPDRAGLQEFFGRRGHGGQPIEKIIFVKPKIFLAI